MKIAITTMIYTHNYVPYLDLLHDKLKNFHDVDLIMFVTNNIAERLTDVERNYFKYVPYRQFNAPNTIEDGGTDYLGTINKFYWSDITENYDYILQIDGDMILRTSLEELYSGITTLIEKYPNNSILGVVAHRVPHRGCEVDEIVISGGYYIVNCRKFRERNIHFDDIYELAIEKGFRTDENVLNYLFDKDEITETMNDEFCFHVVSKFINDSKCGVVRDNFEIVKYLCSGPEARYELFTTMLNILTNMSIER